MNGTIIIKNNVIWQKQKQNERNNDMQESHADTMQKQLQTWINLFFFVLSCEGNEDAFHISPLTLHTHTHTHTIYALQSYIVHSFITN